MLLCLGVVGYGHKEEILSILLQSFGIPALPYLTYGSIYSIILLELYDYCWNIRLWYEGNICISLSSRKLVHYGIAGLCIVVDTPAQTGRSPRCCASGCCRLQCGPWQRLLQQLSHPASMWLLEVLSNLLSNQPLPAQSD